MAHTDCFCNNMNPLLQTAPIITFRVPYLSSEYRAGTVRLVGLAQTKSLEAKNSKTLATRTIESLRAKLPLTKKQQRKKTGKKGSRRSVTTGGKSVSMTLLKTVPLFPVSKQISGQIYYDYQKTLTGSVGSVPTHFYSANGLFDPDTTGIGHQPIGFDQMMALYEQFTTLRAHIRVTFASNGDHARVGIYLNPDTTNAGLPRLVENGLMKMGLVSGPAAANGRYAFETLELVCDIPKYFGKTREGILADPQMLGTIAANPGEQVYFGVCAWAAFDSTVDVAIGYDVTITYESCYWEPKKLASS